MDGAVPPKDCRERSNRSQGANCVQAQTGEAGGVATLRDGSNPSLYRQTPPKF